MSPFKIRKVIPKDIPKIAQLIHSFGWFRCYNSLPLEKVVDSIKNQYDQIKNNDSHSIFVVENDKQELLGYFAVHLISMFILEGPEYYISEIFLYPQSRNQGIGTAVLQFVTEQAKARGCARVSLLNNKDRESYQRQFFAKKGFTERINMANFILELNLS